MKAHGDQFIPDHRARHWFCCSLYPICQLTCHLTFRTLFQHNQVWEGSISGTVQQISDLSHQPESKYVAGWISRIVLVALLSSPPPKCARRIFFREAMCTFRPTFGQRVGFGKEREGERQRGHGNSLQAREILRSGFHLSVKVTIVIESQDHIFYSCSFNCECHCIAHWNISLM